MGLGKLWTEIGRIFRFGLIGLAATAVYAVVAAAGNEIFLVPAIAASIIGQAAATSVSYFGHSSFSFQVKTSHRDFLWRFLVISALTFGLNIIVTWLIVDVAKLSPRIAIAVVTVLVPLVNYLCNRFWVFRRGLTQASEDVEQPPIVFGARGQS